MATLDLPAAAKRRSGCQEREGLPASDVSSLEAVAAELRGMLAERDEQLSEQSLIAAREEGKIMQRQLGSELACAVAREEQLREKLAAGRQELEQRDEELGEAEQKLKQVEEQERRLRKKEDCSRSRELQLQQTEADYTAHLNKLRYDIHRAREQGNEKVAMLRRALEREETKEVLLEEPSLALKELAIKNLQAQLTTSQQIVATLEASIEECRSVAGERHQKVEALLLKSTGLETTGEALDKDAALQSELVASEGRVQELALQTAQLRQVDSLAAGLESQLSQSGQMVSDMEAALATAQAQVDDAEEACVRACQEPPEAARAERRLWEAQLLSSRKAEEEAEAHAAQLEEELRVFGSISMRPQTRLRQVHSSPPMEATASPQRLEELQRQLKELRSGGGAPRRTASEDFFQLQAALDAKGRRLQLLMAANRKAPHRTAEGPNENTLRSAHSANVAADHGSTHDGVYGLGGATTRCASLRAQADSTIAAVRRVQMTAERQVAGFAAARTRAEELSTQAMCRAARAEVSLEAARAAAAAAIRAAGEAAKAETAAAVRAANEASRADTAAAIRAATEAARAEAVAAVRAADEASRADTAAAIRLRGTPQATEPSFQAMSSAARAFVSATGLMKLPAEQAHAKAQKLRDTLFDRIRRGFEKLPQMISLQDAQQIIRFCDREYDTGDKVRAPPPSHLLDPGNVAPSTPDGAPPTLPGALAAARARRDEDDVPPHRRGVQPLRCAIRKGPSGVVMNSQRGIQFGPYGPRISQVKVATYKASGDTLWFLRPGAYVSCDACLKAVPHSRGSLQGASQRSRFAWDEFLCTDCRRGERDLKDLAVTKLPQAVALAGHLARVWVEVGQQEAGAESFGSFVSRARSRSGQSGQEGKNTSHSRSGKKAENTDYSPNRGEGEMEHRDRSKESQSERGIKSQDRDEKRTRSRTCHDAGTMNQERNEKSRRVWQQDEEDTDGQPQDEEDTEGQQQDMEDTEGQQQDEEDSQDQQSDGESNSVTCCCDRCITLPVRSRVRCVCRLCHKGLAPTFRRAIAAAAAVCQVRGVDAATKLSEATHSWSAGQSLRQGMHMFAAVGAATVVIVILVLAASAAWRTRAAGPTQGGGRAAARRSKRQLTVPLGVRRRPPARNRVGGEQKACGGTMPTEVEGLAREIVEGVAAMAAERPPGDPRRWQRAIEEDSALAVESVYGHIQPGDAAVPVFVTKTGRGGDSGWPPVAGAAHAMASDSGWPPRAGAAHAVASNSGWPPFAGAAHAMTRRAAAAKDFGEHVVAPRWKASIQDFGEHVVAPRWKASIQDFGEHVVAPRWRQQKASTQDFGEHVVAPRWRQQKASNQDFGEHVVVPRWRQKKASAEDFGERVVVPRWRQKKASAENFGEHVVVPRWRQMSRSRRRSGKKASIQDFGEQLGDSIAEPQGEKATQEATEATEVTVGPAASYAELKRALRNRLARSLSLGRRASTMTDGCPRWGRKSQSARTTRDSRRGWAIPGLSAGGFNAEGADRDGGALERLRVVAGDGPVSANEAQAAGSWLSSATEALACAVRRGFVLDRSRFQVLPHWCLTPWMARQWTSGMSNLRPGRRGGFAAAATSSRCPVRGASDSLNQCASRELTQHFCGGAK
ncbi:unnamed protein product [Polarella glacialis]|uniref:Uncharacterized protein n=1 Tax=Polarella glacialis TaxID=89957 RepID=A0A813GD18_POLGL|nr:unnamed protein product [Polarella glacialis]